MIAQELGELPASAANAIAVISVLVAVGGALLYLAQRPHLTGDQKLVALMVGLAVGVPAGGVLAGMVMAAIFLPACSSGCHVESEGVPWLIITPVAIGIGISVVVVASVADRREQRAGEVAEN